MRVVLGRVGLAVLVTGCVPEEEPPLVLPGHPCHSEVARLEVAPPDGEYGGLADGGELWCGNPPQGGAPYSPFRVRLLGPEIYQDGAIVEMVAADVADGSEVAYTSLPMGLTCANVGDSEGFWVGSEAHMRYPGVALADLPGREVDLTIRAWPTEGGDPLLEETWRVTLTDVRE